MEIYFENKKLRKKFESHESLKKHFGVLVMQISRRLVQIEEAANLRALLDEKVGRIGPLSGPLYGYFSIRISKNYRMIVAPKGDNILDEENNYLPENITQIILINVEDYHGA